MSTLPNQSEARALHIRLCKQYQVDSLREAALALAEELQYVLSMVDELEPQPFYQPVPRGLELKIGEKLNHLAALDRLSPRQRRKS